MGVGDGLYMCDVVKKFTFAISSPDEFLSVDAVAAMSQRLRPRLFVMACGNEHGFAFVQPDFNNITDSSVSHSTL